MGQAASCFLQKPNVCHSRLNIFIACTQIIIDYVLSFKIRHCMRNFDEDKRVGFSFEVGVAALALGYSTGPMALC